MCVQFLCTRLNLQSKYTNCVLVTAQDLVFSVYDLSPCTVIRHLSLHTSSQDKGGTTALMIATFRGHSNVVRKLLQAGATVNTTTMVCRPVLEVTHASYPCALIVYVKVWTAHVCTLAY